MEEEEKETPKEEKPITHFIQPDDVFITVKWEFNNKSED